MGCLTFLVSKTSKEYYDLGKIFWEEEDVFKLKAESKRGDGSELATIIADMLGEEKIDAMTADAAAWMLAHGDWKYLTEYDDEYDDVYLAEDEEDAKEYWEEFGADAGEVYQRTGSIWGKRK